MCNYLQAAVVSLATGLFSLGSSVSVSAAQDSLNQAVAVGETFELLMIYETKSSGSKGGSGSSNGRSLIVERIIRIVPDGVEFEYDLPKSADARSRLREWQFPARIFRPTNGGAQLLNRAELEVRRDAFLKAGDIPRSACGQWVFTWTAIQIECDPQSAVRIAENYTLPHAIMAGDVYNDPQAAETGKLESKTMATGEVLLSTKMPISQEYVLESLAEMDVALAQIQGKQLSFESAFAALSRHKVDGLIDVEFTADKQGRVHQKTKIVEFTITAPDGETNTERRKETIEKRRLN